eukprot:884765_1
MKILNTSLTIIILLQHVILINSVQQDDTPSNNDDESSIEYTHSWPHFYHLGESTHPTQSILNNLTYYQNEWRKLQTSEAFDQTYTFTMAWDCAPSLCNKCFQANKFINVDDDKILSLTTSELLNDNSKIIACQQLNNSNDISQYRTIDQLYEAVIKFVQDGLNAPQSEKKDYLIIELMLHQYYYFPMNVKLEQGETYYAWDIPCFEPGHIENENDVCDYTYFAAETEKKWTFWITEEMQSFLGWSMIFLILIACSLGYCINWLKKKKSEKIEAWREKEDRARKAEEEKDKEKRDRNNRRDRGKYKGKRKSSKGKHRAHLEKSKRSKRKEYANIPINISDDISDDNISDDNKEE